MRKRKLSHHFLEELFYCEKHKFLSYFMMRKEGKKKESEDGCFVLCFSGQGHRASEPNMRKYEMMSRTTVLQLFFSAVFFCWVHEMLYPDTSTRQKAVALCVAV